jgi:hypothetical protein
MVSTSCRAFSIEHRANGAGRQRFQRRRICFLLTAGRRLQSPLRGSPLALLRSSRPDLDWPAMVFGGLLHFYGRDWPPSIVPPDGNSQAVKFIQPNTLNGAGFPIGENDGPSDERGLHVPERGEDRRRVELHTYHGVPQSTGERVSGVHIAFERCASRGRDAGPKNSRQPDYKSPCSRGHTSWRQRHISNHDCSRTRSNTPTHRVEHPVEFASMHLHL